MTAAEARRRARRSGEIHAQLVALGLTPEEAGRILCLPPDGQRRLALAMLVALGGEVAS